MGRRGPQPRPTALKLLHGEQKSRINFDEPQPRDGEVLAPDGMADDVRAIWDYILSELDHMGLAKRPDVHQLRAYCEAVVAHAKAAKLLSAGGVVIRSETGRLRVNPAMEAMTKAARTMLLFGREFGLTPSSRVQFTTEKLAADNADRLLS